MAKKKSMHARKVGRNAEQVSDAVPAGVVSFRASVEKAKNASNYFLVIRRVQSGHTCRVDELNATNENAALGEARRKVSRLTGTIWLAMHR